MARINTTLISALVDEGLTLRTEIDIREKRLKEIETELKAHAEKSPDRHVPLKDEDREGTRFLCAGTDLTVPVIFTSDLIAQSFPDKSESLIDVTTLAAGHMAEFYKRTVTWNAVHVKSSKFDGKGFRASARALLPDPEAFIHACLRKGKNDLPVSQTKVSWDDAE